MRLTVHPASHRRFFTALCIGVAVWLATFQLAHALRLVIGGDAFFVTYLTAVAIGLERFTPETMRKSSKRQDEGVTVIFLITLFVVLLSIASIFALLNETRDPTVVNVTLSILTTILGWFTFHTVLAFHYAHRFYARRDLPGEERRDAGGLTFPDTDEPNWSDFLYHSLVIGMTAQVADIDITTSRMRRLVMAHSVVAFFFNTIILALAINVAAGQVH